YGCRAGDRRLHRARQGRRRDRASGHGISFPSTMSATDPAPVATGAAPTSLATATRGLRPGRDEAEHPSGQGCRLRQLWATSCEPRPTTNHTASTGSDPLLNRRRGTVESKAMASPGLGSYSSQPTGTPKVPFNTYPHPRPWWRIRELSEVEAPPTSYTASRKSTSSLLPGTSCSQRTPESSSITFRCSGCTRGAEPSCCSALSLPLST